MMLSIQVRQVGTMPYEQITIQHRVSVLKAGYLVSSSHPCVPTSQLCTCMEERGFR